MSAVLHPTGPEEPRTYWIRRVVVLAAVTLVVLVILWAFRPADRGVRAVPEPGSSGPTAAASPDASVDSSPTPSPTAGPSRSASSASPSGSATRGAAAELEEAELEEAEQKEAEQEKAEQEKAEQEKEPVACRGGDVGVELDGSSRPEPGEDHDLTVSLRNQSADPCALTLDQKTFELRVDSGSDRIWTTDHCADWLEVAKEDRAITLEPDGVHTWKLTWPVQRSTEDCDLADQALGSGTYVATAVYAEAEPAQLVMVLR